MCAATVVIVGIAFTMLQEWDNHELEQIATCSSTVVFFSKVQLQLATRVMKVVDFSEGFLLQTFHPFHCVMERESKGEWGHSIICVQLYNSVFSICTVYGQVFGRPKMSVGVGVQNFLGFSIRGTKKNEIRLDTCFRIFVSFHPARCQVRIMQYSPVRVRFFF